MLATIELKRIEDLFVISEALADFSKRCKEGEWRAKRSADEIRAAVDDWIDSVAHRCSENKRAR